MPHPLSDKPNWFLSSSVLKGQINIRPLHATLSSNEIRLYQPKLWGHLSRRPIWHPIELYYAIGSCNLKSLGNHSKWTHRHCVYIIHACKRKYVFMFSLCVNWLLVNQRKSWSFWEQRVVATSTFQLLCVTGQVKIKTFHKYLGIWLNLEYAQNLWNGKRSCVVI